MGMGMRYSLMSMVNLEGVGKGDQGEECQGNGGGGGRGKGGGEG